jgi:uncharacterized SAM-binding protein YcdF (DUF218 family)
VDNDLLEVLRFLAINEAPDPCDIILCFGSLNLGTARTGAELYRRGVAPRVVVTGGTAGRIPPHMTEADGYLSVLTGCGVPTGDVIVERRAQHTGQNVVLGMAAAQRHGVEVRAATLVALPTALRRCKATVAHHFPAVQTFAQPGVPDFDMFFRDPPAALRLIEDEMWRLRTYADFGHMIPVRIPEAVENALGRFRRRLDADRDGFSPLVGSPGLEAVPAGRADAC